MKRIHCKDCPAWDKHKKQTDSDVVQGDCRLKSPTNPGFWPATETTDWCLEASKEKSDG